MAVTERETLNERGSNETFVIIDFNRATQNQLLCGFKGVVFGA